MTWTAYCDSGCRCGTARIGAFRDLRAAGTSYPRAAKHPKFKADLNDCWRHPFGPVDVFQAKAASMLFGRSAIGIALGVGGAVQGPAGGGRPRRPGDPAHDPASHVD